MATVGLVHHHYHHHRYCTWPHEWHHECRNRVGNQRVSPLLLAFPWSLSRISWRDWKKERKKIGVEGLS
jgi:hypothetical protein